MRLGNHDLSLDPEYTPKNENGWSVTSSNIEQSRELLQSLPGVIYLQHSSANIHLPQLDISLRVFGSPYSPAHADQNWAFQYSEDQADALWDTIPMETDLLITHTPPRGHCDISQHWREGGCPSLARALRRVKPALHICGHCHEGRGAQIVRWGDSLEGVDEVRKWGDPSIGTKKQSLLDLTNLRGDKPLESGKETAIINASVMAKSWGRSPKEFNKPVVVDINFELGIDHRR